jgi:hypothetical protein
MLLILLAATYIQAKLCLAWLGLALLCFCIVQTAAEFLQVSKSMVVC